ncbi:MAG: Two-component sensor histidine kinase [Rhodospirillales bacterium]|nr:Two-component sensor histidine kinase [Rhodospirillales bacterium]
MLMKRLRFTLGLQLFLLLFAAVLVAQAIIVAVVLLLPPPPPELYELSDVAERLQGATVQPARGEALKREVRARPPAQHGGIDGRRDLLAQLLRVPPSDVVLTETIHDALVRRELHGSPQRNPAGMFARPWINGPFVAALHLPSGEWAVVEPEYEPFLSAWERRRVLWFVVSAAAMALLAAFSARRFAKPIREFATAADRLGKQLDHPPLTPSGPSELRLAITAFNRMQERLLRYVGDRTAMLAAIAHDLRTPMMRLRFRLEQAPPALRDPALADLREMQAMVQGVLAFVRDESDAGPRQRIDLASLLESLVEDMRVTGAQVELADAPALIVEGDGAALRRLFANLIDNAIQYGGVARLSVAREGDDAVTCIEDDGPGLPDHELERVFEPFYRTEPSRNRETGGIGLGLAVVRTLVRAHGGDVTLASRASHGLVATVRLPLGE